MSSGIWYAFAFRFTAGFLFGGFEAAAAFDVDAFGIIQPFFLALQFFLFGNLFKIQQPTVVLVSINKKMRKS